MKLDRCELQGFWGRSPAVDVCDYAESGGGGDEVSVLLVEPGDCRHILKYASKSHSHKTKIFIHEASGAMVARHLLLLTVAFDRGLGLDEKTELFAELYGNVRVRKRTAALAREMAGALVEAITGNGKHELFDFGQLRMRDVDEIEAALSWWREEVGAAGLWDWRLRSHLGERYDSRANIFDWDFAMVLRERNAEIINWGNYRKWREEGIAFDLREDSYTEANRTLVTSVNGRVGYWGDIVTGPFVAFGLETPNGDHLRKTNGVHDRTAAELTEINLREMFGRVGELGGGGTPGCPGLSIVFLPMVPLARIAAKPKFQNLFDLLYFSCPASRHIPLDPQFYRSDSRLVVENCRFVLPFTSQDIADVADRVQDHCSQIHFAKQDSSNIYWQVFSRSGSTTS